MNLDKEEFNDAALAMAITKSRIVDSNVVCKKNVVMCLFCLATKPISGVGAEIGGNALSNNWFICSRVDHFQLIFAHTVLFPLVFNNPVFGEMNRFEVICIHEIPKKI